MDGLGLNDWELRPGGMLVQKRSSSSSPFSGPLLQLKVSHGLQQHDITIPSEATFGKPIYKFSSLYRFLIKLQILFFSVSLLRTNTPSHTHTHIHTVTMPEISMLSCFFYLFIKYRSLIVTIINPFTSYVMIMRELWILQ